MTAITAQHCTACDTIIDTSDLVPVYECGTCGHLDDERRCENCHTFKARAEHRDGCPTCYGETEQVEAVTDHDGTLIRAVDYDPHTSYAERQAAAAAKARAVANAKQQRKTAQAIRDGRTITVRDLTRGDELILDADNPFDTSHAIAYVTDAGTPGTSIIFTEYVRGALSVAAAPSDAPIHVEVDRYDKATDVTGDLYQVTVAPEPTVMSAVADTFLIETGLVGDRDARVPALSILIGDTNVNSIGCWADPALTARALDELDALAHRLAEARGVTLPATDTLPHTPVRERGVLHHNLTGINKAMLAVNSWSEDDLPALEFDVTGSARSISDPAALLAATATARTLLPTLTLIPVTA